MQLQKMLTPYKINQCEIKNRFVVPAMVTNFCDENGNITDEFVQYHLAKAKGGWGLIITEGFGVNPHGIGYKNCAFMMRSRFPQTKNLQMQFTSTVPKFLPRYSILVVKLILPLTVTSNRLLHQQFQTRLIDKFLMN